MGGLPNITKRIKGNGYEEVIMQGESHTVANNIYSEITTDQDTNGN